MTDAKSVSFPVLPLRDIVVFPNMIVPLFVGREKSVRALEARGREEEQGGRREERSQTATLTIAQIAS